MSENKRQQKNYVPAFPTGAGSAYGMHFRDYFAAKAMAVILLDKTDDLDLSDKSEYAYRVADKMIEARDWLL